MPALGCIHDALQVDRFIVSCLLVGLAWCRLDGTSHAWSNGKRGM